MESGKLSNEFKDGSVSLAVGDQQMCLRAKATARDTLGLSILASTPSTVQPILPRFVREHQASATMSETRYATHAWLNIVARSRNHCSSPFNNSIKANEFFFCVVVALFYGREIKLQKLYHFQRSATKHIFRTLRHSNASAAPTALDWVAAAYVNTNQQCSSALTPSSVRCRPHLLSSNNRNVKLSQL